MTWLRERLEQVDGDRIAVSAPDVLMTYSELLDRIDRCAALLDRSRRGDVVIVRFERSDPAAVVACLAVWHRAGVPLFQDAAASSMLTMRTGAALGARFELRRITHEPSEGLSLEGVQGGWMALVEESGPVLCPSIACEDAAYLVQTSGSSGLPRASLNTGAGLRNTVEGIVERYAINAQARTLQFAPLNYDAWIAEVVPTLVAGATLVLGARGGWSRFGEIRELLERQRVTHLTAPPSVWRRLATLDPPLKVAIAAGEALDRSTLLGIERSARRVINAYGPSEAAICALSCDVSAADEEISLGTPLPNVRVTITPYDAVADQVVGLLRIHGAGVAAGYVGERRLERSANQGWFGQDEEGRFFQTADIVRIENDRIVFLGRADRAIKRAGRMLSLDRIELAVRGLAGVRECSVVERGSTIVCEYMPAPGRPVPTTQQLDGVLERWELPAGFEPVDGFRLTASDKLDRSSAAPAGGVDPDPDVEALRELWKDATGSDAGDLSFFACGGDSLAAMELLDRVCELFDVDIEIAEMLDAPTLTSLIRLVREAGST
ncbi:MAG: non-ribosomal peptide synthetase [Solirubrobacteraceae bacterium]